MEISLLAALIFGISGYAWLNQTENRLNRAAPGWYEWRSTVKTNYPPDFVKAALYIPKDKHRLAKLPLVIYYHGGTANQDEYRNAEFLAQWAEEKGFVLLSVQDRWALNVPADTDKTVLDSLNATVEFIERMKQYRYIDLEHTYVTGFSGGGFLALCAGFYRPELFTEVGDFKGNFYQNPFEAILIQSQSQTTFNRENWNRLNIWMCLGGESDAPRVRSQVPQALGYLNQLRGRGVLFQYYPDEGHVLSKRDFDDFWATTPENPLR